VTKQNLDGAQIGPRIEHVGGAGVAKQVRMDHMGNTGSGAGLAAQTADRTIIERAVRVLFGGEQPVLRLAPPIIDPQTLQQCRRQRNIPWNTAFSFAHMHNHVSAVDITYLQMAKLVAPQGRSTERCDDRPMFQVAGAVENASDLLLSEHFRQPQSPFGNRFQSRPAPPGPPAPPPGPPSLPPHLVEMSSCSPAYPFPPV
jgi:hypothetical protein